MNFDLSLSSFRVKNNPLICTKPLKAAKYIYQKKLAKNSIWLKEMGNKIWFWALIYLSVALGLSSALEILLSCSSGHMGDFTQGGEWLLKNGTIFFYGKIYTSLNISIDGLQPTCRYQLRVSSRPHNFSLGHALVELV